MRASEKPGNKVYKFRCQYCGRFMWVGVNLSNKDELAVWHVSCKCGASSAKVSSLIKPKVLWDESQMFKHTTQTMLDKLTEGV